MRGRDGRPILIGISFHAEPGKILGIIGPSGSGKTTLGKIIVGALAADRRRGAHRRRPFDRLGPGRARPVYRLHAAGAVAVRRDDQGEHLPLRAAAKRRGSRKRSTRPLSPRRWKPGVHEMILQLPQGYDTPLGLMGAGLSAGQSQRIALARALYGEPRCWCSTSPTLSSISAGEALARRRARHSPQARRDSHRHRAPPRRRWRPPIGCSSSTRAGLR